jgi:hypothetical protein
LFMDSGAFPCRLPIIPFTASNSSAQGSEQNALPIRAIGRAVEHSDLQTLACAAGDAGMHAAKANLASCTSRGLNYIFNIFPFINEQIVYFI